MNRRTFFSQDRLKKDVKGCGCIEKELPQTVRWSMLIPTGYWRHGVRGRALTKAAKMLRWWKLLSPDQYFVRQTIVTCRKNASFSVELYCFCLFCRRRLPHLPHSSHADITLTGNHSPPPHPPDPWATKFFDQNPISRTNCWTKSPPWWQNLKVTCSF